MERISMKYEVIHNRLVSEYKLYGRILIALSGGVDSCLAAYLGRQFLGRENAVAVISNSASLKEKDFEIAIKFCADHDIKFEVIFTSELENSNYTSNPDNRCYFCKNELYDEMNNLVSEKYSGFSIINGNNFSDLGDYRPGLNSASENDIKSPFISCKVNKEKIRGLAKHFNLPVWDKPASPCLSSRFPYGESINEEKLKRVEAAEEILNQFGFEEVRVRSFGDTAKIEVPSEKLNQLNKLHSEIDVKFKSIGYNKSEIDNEGFVSGKMNRVLS